MMATLTVPPSLVSPREDAIQLHKAFKGYGCDNAAVIGILAHRDATQRAYIEQEYRTMYSEDINKRLASELSGKLETAVLLWMHDPAKRDATILRGALYTGVINLGAVTEVICSRTSSQLQTLKQIYHATFGTYLENDIEIQATGDHQKILLACLSKPRYEGMEVDREMAAKDAKALYKAGEKKLGTDEKVFVQIFSERSRAHLIAINTCYHDMYGGSLKKAIKKETSGLFECALLTILQCAENPAKYFAKVLYKSMQGLGTNDTTLIRVITTRTEIDMQYIKVEYHKKYNKSLNDVVHSETSGHYRTFLLSLLGPNH
ncbi:putative annexin [Helianthus annuus]|nr:annexin D5 [Helianthus annuus]KAF5773608.1 putative annexin [Helianthus annuus]KAJ0477089.1 putative annexin [Helianthus annuus]KAJ0481456.1 putative annexin [Helianthus annuus]KAJ0497910.1 putative annexin [Helianthus annuus]KAJ0663917.1 putative annexin [Helianthus annuus]